MTRGSTFAAGLLALATGCSHHAASSGGDSGDLDAPGDGGGDAVSDALGIDAPGATAPALLVDGTGLYPRAIRTASGAIVASVVAPQASGRMGGTILRSDDDGVTFHVAGHVDDAAASGGLCCASLYELPRALGALPAGTILWAASIGGDAPDAPMQIAMWASGDGGATWGSATIIATGGVARKNGGMWEPELAMLDDGTLVCHYSDETDGAHSQKLVEVRSSDGAAWSAPANTVALAAFGARPGMANVRRLASGTYVMSYELCGVPADNCTAHLRTSADGWSWGNPADAGIRPQTVDGLHFAHAPTLAVIDAPGANGRLFMIGQMVYDGAGNVAATNGSLALGNTEGGGAYWYPLAAPVPIAAPYDNFCPNYSSPLVPLDGGAFGLEIASQWDGSVCRAYFARAPLLGTGDATGIHDGDRARFVNTESALCLDVSGGSLAAGATIQQWTCNNLAPQDWTLASLGSGAFSLTSAQSGLCLTATGGLASAVQQQPCDGRATQAWTPSNVGSGAYTLHNSGLCLDDSAGSTAPGNPLQLWTCNDLSPQLWQRQPR